MVTEHQLQTLQRKIADRSATFRKAASELVQFDASPVNRAEVTREYLVYCLDRVREGLARSQRELRELLQSSETVLVSPAGADIASSGEIIVAANRRLLRFLSENPQYIHTLRPRSFEELIAGIFSDLGYRVELMPATHDGGKDLILRADGPLGGSIAYVQCKQYSPIRPVGIEIVRALYGVHVADNVNKSMIVTTSHYSQEAIDFSRGLAFLISLKNYKDIVGWLRRYRGETI